MIRPRPSRGEATAPFLAVVSQAVLGLALACPASAQLSGTYTVDPSGSGTRNFTTLNAASMALMVNGVSAPVEIRVASGTYTATWFIPPVPGTSASNKVTLRAATPGAVTIQGAGANRAVEFVFGTNSAPVEWIVLDGFRFPGTATTGSTVYGSLYPDTNPLGIQHVEIRNCEFAGAGVALDGMNHDVHHNQGTNATVSLRGHGHRIHHNELWQGSIRFVHFSRVLGATTLIYNNLVAEGAGALYVIGWDTEVTHNTFASTVGRGMVELHGHPLRPIQFHGNVVVTLGTSCCKERLVHMGSYSDSVLSDANIYLSKLQNGSVITQGSGAYATLSAWQTASGQDKNSLEVDPGFVNTGSDFHLLANSPAIDRALQTPSYVTDDLDGNPRDGKPDIGCFESFIPFTLFGRGCPGTLLNQPKLGTSGAATIPSSNFAFTLSDALGGAPCFLAFGSSNTSWGSIPLPLTLGGNCRILVAPDLLFGATAAGSGAGNGTASLKLSIPNDPKLRGLIVFVQWAVVDAAATGGLAFSEGGRLELR